MKLSHFVPLPNLKICFANYLGKTIVNLGYTISLITPNSSEMGGDRRGGGGGEKTSSKKEKTLTNLAINIRLNLFFLLLLCTLFT